MKDNICWQLLRLPGEGMNYLQLVTLIMQEAYFKMWWDKGFFAH